MPNWMLVLDAVRIAWQPTMTAVDAGEGLVSVVMRLGQWDDQTTNDPPIAGTMLIPEGAWQAFRDAFTGHTSRLAVVIRERDHDEPN